MQVGQNYNSFTGYFYLVESFWSHSYIDDEIDLQSSLKYNTNGYLKYIVERFVISHQTPPTYVWLPRDNEQWLLLDFPR